VAPAEDPLREILALPKGIARLDAFEKALESMPPGTHGHRLLTQGFFGTLIQMAHDAGVDLALLGPRVKRCAEALVDAGEVEKAAELYSRIGRTHRAAELFASTGAIEELEATAFAAPGDSDPTFKAHLAYQRFETYFSVGLRDRALDALKEATSLQPGNSAYLEIQRGVHARLPRPGTLHLQCDNHHLILRQGWPVEIGRGEEMHLQVKSPVISRRHAQVEERGGTLYLNNLTEPKDLLLDGLEVGASVALPAQGTLSLGGVQVGFSLDGGILLLWPLLDASRITCCARANPFKAPTPSGQELTFSFGDDGRARLHPGTDVEMEDSELRHPTLLLNGDQVQHGKRTWRVVDTQAGF
jgi:tetratricopeptide (TPR) repeat protein